ncbi:hypothetical protein CASFOL_005034 [Castilleja foliolosa]|uniref:Phosphoacetylglucosamine mutase n=1 Tax=Castilleja foliolosa TaxID=1961234 RepID=A0ABD3E3D0_9LAMI
MGNITLEGSPSLEVLLGRDTRPSGSALVEAAKQGINSIFGVTARDTGVVTTPQLHWMVRAKNKGFEASENDYYNQLLTSFRCVLDYIPQGNSSNNVNANLIVDGADGVGGEKLKKMKTELSNLTIDIRNYGDGVLNEAVGADYVQKEKVIPRGFSPADAGISISGVQVWMEMLTGSYISPLYQTVARSTLSMGDKILSLFAIFLKEQLAILYGPEDGKNANKSYNASLGIVQTAYANGASTDYLKQLGLEVALTPTGVKYLHEKASEFDIGIYFEANGHGTILFSDKFISWLETRSNELSTSSKGSDQHKAALRLLAVSRLINQAFGDALSGLLLVEAILQHMGWSIRQKLDV